MVYKWVSVSQTHPMKANSSNISGIPSKFWMIFSVPNGSNSRLQPTDRRADCPTTGSAARDANTTGSRDVTITSSAVAPSSLPGGTQKREAE